ncbi:hypothetical protein [Sphingomonas prati]|uniref:Putative flap endonuclease-1-like 5' DNA nuclease n=1 Tax=Sphingomonas prati TaxID=1843237 RepID=A0A7W9BSH0_9SPHN|nr:hypothetical protein [Sphingomonas prati]MBB5729267.1 putative flap endonuclease-1-like 5' DNA nuclease [Sphingomonas prati]GGE78774.1 hypothetical protein GCM10011404_09350 [Sphingomonas prati]
MPAFTTNQWAILLLVLVLGWLLGLASRSGGAKWRRAYEAERADHAAARTAHDARLAAANDRIAQFERSNHSGIANGTGLGVAGGLGAAGAGQRDDLSLIRGVGRGDEARLKDLGVHSYRDIVRMSAADEAALENKLGATPGVIARERWREQAELLDTGRHDDHRRTFS